MFNSLFLLWGRAALPRRLHSEQIKLVCTGGSQFLGHLFRRQCVPSGLLPQGCRVGFHGARTRRTPLLPRLPGAPRSAGQRGSFVLGSAEVQHAGPRNLLVLECGAYFLSSDDSFNCRTVSCRVLLVHLPVSLNLVAISWNRLFCCCVSQ